MVFAYSDKVKWMEAATKLAKFNENQGEVIKVWLLKYKHDTSSWGVYIVYMIRKLYHSILCFQLCLGPSSPSMFCL